METVRNVVRDLRLLTSSSDVSASKDTDSIPNVLRQENRARKAFVKDILGTRPGFNGENDTIATLSWAYLQVVATWALLMVARFHIAIAPYLVRAWCHNSHHVWSD
jgi:hypothetical protein